MSQNTRFLCYFFLLKYSSVLYFLLFPSLEVRKLGAALTCHTGQEKSEAFGAPLGATGGSGPERQPGNLGKPGAVPA